LDSGGRDREAAEGEENGGGEGGKEEEKNSKHTAINMASHNLFLNLQR
jgi:hypothetical protein